jgi:hypothetical protein
MFSLAAEWLKSAKTPEEKETTKNIVLNAAPAFNLMRKLLQDRKLAISPIREEDYEKGDWAAKQAHKNGRVNEIDHLLQMITFKERP